MLGREIKRRRLLPSNEDAKLRTHNARPAAAPEAHAH